MTSPDPTQALRERVLAEVETALKQFDRLVCQGVDCGPPIAPNGGIASVVERSDALHVLLHLRMRLREALASPALGETVGKEERHLSWCQKWQGFHESLYLDKSKPCTCASSSRDTEGR